ncbi:hypothetical protein DM860_014168 [Cuscuta australis]|uniref:Reverse transcriptase zinc-binding domain-containing protein n=1 Tax=Cuscuta australis TaxID=267555 RepID=A0A328DIP4_9ASTE|nr:hypothetical protein DM860_014168 [Cuscuta australis]
MTGFRVTPRRLGGLTVYGTRLPPKVQFIFWLLMRDRLLTKARLAKWYAANTECSLCGDELEDSKHFFVSVRILRVINSVLQPYNLRYDQHSIVEFGEKINTRVRCTLRRETIAAWAMGCYGIWRAQNGIIHQKNITE